MADDLPFHLVDIDAELAFTPGGDEAPAVPDDDDLLAGALVGALLDEELLELVTPRSRAGVEGRLAHLLSQGRDAPEALAAAIVAHPGVAELYADDDTLAALLARVRQAAR